MQWEETSHLILCRDMIPSIHMFSTIAYIQEAGFCKQPTWVRISTLLSNCCISLGMSLLSFLVSLCAKQEQPLHPYPRPFTGCGQHSVSKCVESLALGTWYSPKVCCCCCCHGCSYHSEFPLDGLLAALRGTAFCTFFFNVI